MGTDPAIIADHDVAIAAAEVSDVGNFFDLGGKRITAQPVDAMMTAQIDFDVTGNRRISAYTQCGSFMPVMYLEIAIGANSKAELRITVAQFLCCTLKLRQCTQRFAFLTIAPDAQ